jgi:fibronectin-binding autotransporter adhesin
MGLVLDRRCSGAGLFVRAFALRTGTRAPARRLLLAGTMLASALAMLAPATSHAQDATWSGSTSGDWNTNGNWSPASVPTGTATFDNTGLTQTLTVSADASINTISLSAGAPTYSYTINPGVAFNIVGAGIVNNSANAPNFLNNGTLNFSSSSTVANANVINNSSLNFNNTSTAGSASITNNFILTFDSGSSAGTAAITNSGLTSFTGTSTAGSATITTNGGAGTATQFLGNSTGGSAQFITNAGGTVDFSGTSGPLGNNQISAGSIAGSGTYKLGANQLTVGSNNLSTAVSGDIQDGGQSGGVGASLVKVGSGILTLSGTNTYTGATTINAGTLIAASNGALPTTTVTVNTGATLTIADTVQADIGSLAGGGSVKIGTTDATTTLFIGAANPATTTFSGAITGPGSLELDGGRLTLTGAGNNIGGNLDLCACDIGGLTINGGTFIVGGTTTVEGGTLAVSNGGTLTTATDTLVTFGSKLTVSSGGTLNSATLEIGDLITGTSIVTVTGAGSTVNATTALAVGTQCGCEIGTLTIADGAVVNSPTFTGVGAGSTLNLGVGGWPAPGLIDIQLG